MRFVSPALKNIVFPVLSRSGYLRFRAGAGPAIVTYHGVFPGAYKIRNPFLDGNLVRAESFRRQLRLLKSRYRLITPENFLGWIKGEQELPPRSILLTCDDALKNTLTEMVPILRESGAACLFFATAASAEQAPNMLWYEELYLMLLDANPVIAFSITEAGVCVDGIGTGELHSTWWNVVEQLTPFSRETRAEFLAQIRSQLKLPDNWKERYLQDSTLADRFLTLDRTGLRELATAGMSIGAHSLSHPILARISDEMARQEIAEIRSVLEKALEQPVWAFGYPFGDAAAVSRRDIQLAEEAGYACAFMNVGGGFGAKLNRFALPRIHVTADMGLGEFEAHISGFYGSLRRRLAPGAGSPEIAVS